MPVTVGRAHFERDGSNGKSRDQPPCRRGLAGLTALGMTWHPCQVRHWDGRTSDGRTKNRTRSRTRLEEACKIMPTFSNSYNRSFAVARRGVRKNRAKTGRFGAESSLASRSPPARRSLAAGPLTHPACHAARFARSASPGAPEPALDPDLGSDTLQASGAAGAKLHSLRGRRGENRNQPERTLPCAHLMAGRSRWRW